MLLKPSFKSVCDYTNNPDLIERTFHFYLYKILYSTTEGQRYIKRGNESTLNPGKQFKIRNLYMSQALNIKK